ncbi:hypothetical protein [Phormidium sp. FACHB-1136]|uniref:hypothetical protein n=1 Tax=Phormidium sp. FACHB-1136 TaxID=2692848 RepID=UPI0016854125|nr:hypothetical protein [Phormidium sp. FACHB-1136]MBD2429382.1 hypothetical protein [Phormidium sp. FACHB-1136]
MAKSDSRLFITPSTDLDEFIFNGLREGGNASTKSTRAIVTYYLAEMAYQVDPNLDDPKLRMAVLKSIHELEARINLIKSLFPDLVSTPLSTQDMEPPSFNHDQPRLQVVPDPVEPDQREARPDKTDSSPTSAVEIDTSDTPWAGLTIISEKEA